METILDSSMSSDGGRKAAKEAQRLAGEFRSDFDDAANRGRDTAKDLSEKIRGAVDDAAASGQNIAEEYVKRGKRHLSRTAERVSAYADDNTAALAIGTFAIGVLVGYLARRR